MDAALEYHRDCTFLSYTHKLIPYINRNYGSGDISLRNSSDCRGENNSNTILIVIKTAIFIISILGVVGNGIVIWLLGFRVLRNPFMTYILNLATADFGLLISDILHSAPFEILPEVPYKWEVIEYFSALTYSASQFLLTAISIERCVAAFFPLWYRCHRPPRLPTIVCALVWVLSFLLATVKLTALIFKRYQDTIHLFFQVIVNAALCLPLVSISTVALFIKVCFKSRQHQRGKLLTVLLLTLSFFLLCAFPFNVILILTVLGYLPEYCPDVAILLSSLNSSVNPVIYFLVGRQRKTRCRESLKMILQRAFKNEEDCIENTPEEIQL